MKTVGFVGSRKENERRRALLPRDLQKIRFPGQLFIEKGYGAELGFSDSEYTKLGANIVSQKDAYGSDIICNPKALEASERVLFTKEQTLFGWIHAVQGRSVTDFLIEKTMTGISWENMFEGNRHCYWKNNELAGKAAIIDSLRFLGKSPNSCKAGLIGRGNVSRGAYGILSQMGTEVTVYNRKTVHLLRKELGNYDMIINGVMWDVFRSDHLIYRDDLKNMKPGSIIVDISCDEGMGIETSRPTSIKEPVYVVDGIVHYAVDHTPTILYRTASEHISSVVCRYIDILIEDVPNLTIKNATIIREGIILDERIKKFQHRY